MQVNFKKAMENIAKAVENWRENLQGREDLINNPSHYNQGRIETIDAIEGILNEEEMSGYLAGNIIKYVARYKYKNGVEDLKKAEWYLNRLIGLQERDADE